MNTFEKNTQEAVLWIRENQERFWAIVGGVFLSILFIGLVIHHRDVENDQAWFELGSVQAQLMNGKLEDARKGLETWQTRFQGSSAASYAQFMKADLLYRTHEYAQASQVYADIVRMGKPEALKPLALSAQADCEEMAGHLPQAQALSQTFLDQYPDHFLSATRYMSQARLSELSANPTAAAAVYERFVLLFPQSPWTAFAKTRLQALGRNPALPSAQSIPSLPKP